MFVKFIRKTIARIVYPEIFESRTEYHEKFCHLSQSAFELQLYCGYDFPILKDSIEYLFKKFNLHFMSLEEYDAKLVNGDYKEVSIDFIYDFRDKLRRKYLDKKETDDKEQHN